MYPETLKIKSGWYWSAGTKFGWKKDGVDRAGVGIAKNILQNYKEVVVEIDGKKYIVDCERARAFINKYHSAETRYGTTIGIISKEVLERI